MYKDESKQILISISSDSYMSKDDSKSAVTYRMTWTPQSVTMGEMLEYCIDGHTFCNQFCDDNHEIFKKPFNSTYKTDARFLGSDVITIDVDHIEALAEKYKYEFGNLIKELSSHNLEPSLWFTSYSHNPSAGLLKGHLIYAFDSRIPGKDGGKTYRLIANKIEDLITTITGASDLDACSHSGVQYINGTNINNSELHVESGISNLVYEYADFGFENDYIVSFNAEAIKNYKPKEVPKKVSKWVLQSIKECGIEFFIEHNKHRFEYFYRKEEGYEWHTTPTGCQYAFVDDEYFALYYNAKTVKDRQGRRKKVFERMCERRLLKPTASPDEIAYCAVVDIERYFDKSGNVFTAEYIERNVNNCFSLTLDEIKKKYSKNIAKLKERTPKSRVIFKYLRGMDAKQKANERKCLAKERVLGVYDFTLSPTANVSYLKHEYDISISVSTLYSYFKEDNIDYTEYKFIKQEKKKYDIRLCITEMNNNNMSITVRTIKEYLKIKGIKASSKDCCDAIKLMQ